MGVIFKLIYIQLSRLNPYPLPESVVIVDNLVVHKCPLLIEILQGYGIHYIYLSHLIVHFSTQ